MAIMNRRPSGDPNPNFQEDQRAIFDIANRGIARRQKEREAALNEIEQAAVKIQQKLKTLLAAGQLPIGAAVAVQERLFVYSGQILPELRPYFSDGTPCSAVQRERSLNKYDPSVEGRERE
jgi:hypothetical protein